MTEPATNGVSRRLRADVLEALKATFVGKDELIDLLGVALVARENLFLLGPPGTAKSAVVRDLGSRLEGATFEYLLTRFTEPNELFGPFDLRKLREGELVTNTEGMLPEASFVFLDELLNANSAILNTLLTALNERVLRRGREAFDLPTLMVVGASNRLPEEESLRALFDRFLVRVRCDNVEDDSLEDVLRAGWQLERANGAESRGKVTLAEIRALQDAVPTVDLGDTREALATLVRRLRRAGVSVSDRRAVRLQRLIAASALLCERVRAEVSDLWVVRHTWETEEEQEVLAAIVDEAVSAVPIESSAHPRSRPAETVDPEALARDLESLTKQIDTPGDDAEFSAAALHDRLALLEGRCGWVTDATARTHLESTIGALWQRLRA